MPEEEKNPMAHEMPADTLLAAIVDSSFDAIVSKDLDGTITSWNGAAERLFGYPAEEAIGQPILMLIPHDRRHEEEHIIGRIRAGERVETFETLRRRKDGSLVPVSLTISPLRDAAGRIVGASKIARDISSTRDTERRIHLLLREVHHRVKNNLQTVASLVQLQPMADETKRELRGRILAMAAVHEHLHRPGSDGTVNLADYLGGLARAVNDGFGGKVRLVLDLEPVHVGADVATSLGLITNELVSNANKYAYPDRAPGTFRIGLAPAAEASATLRLTNDGIPFDAGASREGIGIRLIRSLSAGIAPDYRFDGRKGLYYEITFQTGDGRDEFAP